MYRLSLMLRVSVTSLAVVLRVNGLTPNPWEIQVLDATAESWAGRGSVFLISTCEIRVVVGGGGCHGEAGIRWDASTYLNHGKWHILKQRGFKIDLSVLANWDDQESQRSDISSKPRHCWIFNSHRYMPPLSGWRLITSVAESAILCIIASIFFFFYFWPTYFEHLAHFSDI